MNKIVRWSFTRRFNYFDILALCGGGWLVSNGRPLIGGLAWLAGAVSSGYIEAKILKSKP